MKVRYEKAGRDMLQQMTLEANAKTLESGVVIQILQHGPNGPNRGIRPTKSSTVKIHYHGTLFDGTVFDSTFNKKRKTPSNEDDKTSSSSVNEPVQFPLAAVIPGWRDGVCDMYEGEIAMIGIPPELAYGDQGTPDGRIPGGSTLFFKIELIQVLSAGIDVGNTAAPTLFGADGTKLQRGTSSSVLLGADGKPLS
jgi:FKBP-type peptidyl-prolyl cis-trans isomerase